MRSRNVPQRSTDMALGEFTKTLKGTNEIELTVTGRASGRKISNPVWFVQEAQTLYLLPVKGSDSDWYKNVLKTPTIRLAAKGGEYSARAAAIRDAAKGSGVAEKFRPNYGAGQGEKYHSEFDVFVDVPFV